MNMPFTNHDGGELHQALQLIIGSSLPVELFDAFLAEYVLCKDLDKALAFARREWDC